MLLAQTNFLPPPVSQNVRRRESQQQLGRSVQSLDVHIEHVFLSAGVFVEVFAGAGEENEGPDTGAEVDRQNHDDEELEDVVHLPVVAEVLEDSGDAHELGNLEELRELDGLAGSGGGGSDDVLERDGAEEVDYEPAG